MAKEHEREQTGQSGQGAGMARDLRDKVDRPTPTTEPAEGDQDVIDESLRKKESGKE